MINTDSNTVIKYRNSISTPINKGGLLLLGAVATFGRGRYFRGGRYFLDLLAATKKWR